MIIIKDYNFAKKILNADSVLDTKLINLTQKMFQYFAK